MAGRLASAGSSSIGEGLGDDAPLDLLAARAEVLDLRREPAGFDVARRQQERERVVGLRDPAGGVDARGEPEGDVFARGRAGRAARDLRQGARAGPGAPRQEREPGADERAVVAVERRHVADGADGDEVEPASHVERDAELARARPRRPRAPGPRTPRPLYGKPHSGRCGLRNASAGAARRARGGGR